MSINKFNSEGYYDPTTYEALTNIEKEERALRDKDCGPRRTHDVNNRRRRGGNKQQLNHHDGTTIMHHKDYAIGGNRGVEP